MATVNVLAADAIRWRKLHRRLTRAGYDVVGKGSELRISRGGDSDAVDTAPCKVDELSEIVVEPATQLIGFRPRDGVTCNFDGLLDEAPAWPTVIDIACAVAVDHPLAVLDDGFGTVYLIHPGRGLIGPGEYGEIQSRPSTADFLRRLFRSAR